MTVSSLLFLLLSFPVKDISGSVSLSTESEIVAIGSDLKLTCINYDKNPSIFYFNRTVKLCECKTLTETCPVTDVNRYNSSFTAGSNFNTYTCIVKSYTKDFCGIFSCNESFGGTDTDNIDIKYAANYNDSCGSCGICNQPNQICDDEKKCACQEFYEYKDGKCRPTTTSAEPTTTISTSTTALITTTATSTNVQTTSQTTATLTMAASSTATLTTATPTMAVPITSTPTTAVPITSTPTTAVPITQTPTTAIAITSTPTMAVLIMSTPTTAVLITSTPTTAVPIASTPTTAVLVMVTSTVTAAPPTAAPSSSTTNQPKNNNMNEEGYIIGGCIGGAVVSVLLIIGIMFCLRRWPMCKCWRNKKFSETSMDPNAKHIPAKHLGHVENSQTRKQYDWPQKSRTPDRSFHYHYNNPSYVVIAGKRNGTSGYLDYSSYPPSYSFYYPLSGKYFRTPDQSRDHSVGQRYAPYPQSPQRGRMQQAWYQPYRPGRPGFYGYFGNWDTYN